MKQKANILTRRPLGVERMVLHGGPLGQARRRNNPRRVITAERGVDRVNLKPIATIFAKHAGISTADNVDCAVVRAVGDAAQIAIECATQSVKRLSGKFAEHDRFTARFNDVSQGSS
jgi:hypothetical protein